MSREIEKLDQKLFDEIAEHYVRKDLVSYCRIARKQRLVSSIKNISKPVNNMLEIGCGAGFTAEYLAGHYDVYEGLDYSKNLITYAKRYNSSERANFICTNIKDYEVKKQYKMILMIGVLHHMPNPEDVLRNLKDYLTPAGVIVVNEPQKGNPIIGLLRKVRKIIDSKYSSDQVEFSSSELREMFTACGYSVHIFSQGVLSTPLAETSFLPAFIGLPLAWLARILDPLLEALLSVSFLRKLSWNIVVEGRPQK